MHRVTICALALWGTLSVAACDEHGNEPGLLAATAAATPEVSHALSMPVHVTQTAQISDCNTGQGGSLSLSGDFTLPATARATLTSCQNGPGASVALSGALTLEGAVAARVTLRDATSASSSATSGTLQIVLVPDQGTVQFAKQPVKGGAGGNPWIYLQFLSPSGVPFGQEGLIRRFSQLA